jgi:hypothetical protein
MNEFPDGPLQVNCAGVLGMNVDFDDQKIPLALLLAIRQGSVSRKLLAERGWTPVYIPYRSPS